MVDLDYKAQRIQRWKSVVGFPEAVKFEALLSLGFSQVSVQVPGYPNAFRLRKYDSDISVFETVFVDHELSLNLEKEPRLIIDGGANIGLTTAYFARNYPQASIIAIEPSSANCSLLKRNCAGFTNVSVLEGGLWPDEGFLRLANPDDESWAFRCEPAQRDSEGSFAAYTIENIIERSGKKQCDLLKLDVEGAEEFLFASGANRWLPLVHTVLVEVHGDRAENAIRAACPEQNFQFRTLGEKLLIVQREQLIN